MHLIAAAEMTPSGVPPMPHSRSTGRVGRRPRAARRATSPSVIRRTRAPASRIACDALLVARAVEHDDHHVADVGRRGARRPAPSVSPSGRSRSSRSATSLAAGHLLHVDARARGRTSCPRSAQRDHGQRARRALRRPAACPRAGRRRCRPRAAMPSPMLLAVVEHRRLVLLALADDDDAVHVDRVEHDAHARRRRPGRRPPCRPCRRSRAAASAAASVTRTSSSARLRSGRVGLASGMRLIDRARGLARALGARTERMRRADDHEQRRRAARGTSRTSARWRSTARPGGR